MSTSTVKVAAPSAPLAVSEEQYQAKVMATGMGMRVVLRGTISTPNPAPVLNPFVDRVHAQACATDEKEVRVDLRDLEFCNSSGFKCFIYWIHRIQELPEPKRYRLRFLSSPARRWQKTSLLALSCFASSLVEIDTSGG
jgi:hypothetical protein